MHFIFIAYGKRSEVDLLFRDMESQKHLMPLCKGKLKKAVWMEGQIRNLPFGVYEYIFPKASADLVLATMCKEIDRYELGGFKLGMLRKMIKCDKLPKFKTEKKFLWIKDNVNIIPIGVRYDKDYTDPVGEHEGWTHEGI